MALPRDCDYALTRFVVPTKSITPTCVGHSATEATTRRTVYGSRDIHRQHL